MKCPVFVAGEERAGEGTMAVHSPYDGKAVGEVAIAGTRDMEDAIASAALAFNDCRQLPRYERQALSLIHI